MAMTWQEFLYPLGLISSLLFTLRMLYQWYLAESSKSSVSPKGFWQLSVAGNLTHLIHSLIQMQLPLALIQGWNLIISKRNLNLLKTQSHHYSIKRVFLHLLIITLATCLGFFVVCFLAGEILWMRIPTFPVLRIEQSHVSMWVHGFGLIGMTLYASRFWIQWISIERVQKSHLGPKFWLLSLTGAIFSTIYFIIIFDWINILSTGFTLIPYSRNLIFSKKLSSS